MRSYSIGFLFLWWITLASVTSFTVSFFQRNRRSGLEVLKTSTACDPQEPENCAILRVAYDGGMFTGWSSANDNHTVPALNTGRRSRRRRRKGEGSYVTRSVQGAIQAVLGRLYGNIDPLEHIVVEGCSRTDKGVHARGQVCLVFAQNNSRRLPLPSSTEKMAYRLNRMLPHDIRVMKFAGYIPSDFHPTTFAVSKTYVYSVSSGKLRDPTQCHDVWHVELKEHLNATAMQTKAKELEGTHDFQAFRAAPRGSSSRERFERQSTVCTLHEVKVEEDLDDQWPHARKCTITIRGDRFLYKMVRNLVGTIVAAGGAKYECAPAHGLALENIEYPVDLEWKNANG